MNDEIEDLLDELDADLLRLRGGRKCPVHCVDEPCPTCTAYIAAGL